MSEIYEEDMKELRILKVFFRLQKEMSEDIDDLIATHDKGAANGEGISLYKRTTLSELKDKNNEFRNLLFNLSRRLKNLMIEIETNHDRTKEVLKNVLKFLERKEN